MDRNNTDRYGLVYDRVALRKESVDRNITNELLTALKTMSLSARRAWIEIFAVISLIYQQAVALRKESVDRNHAADISASREARSLSARRAWIEIYYPGG